MQLAAAAAQPAAAAAAWCPHRDLVLLLSADAAAVARLSLARVWTQPFNLGNAVARAAWQHAGRMLAVVRRQSNALHLLDAEQGKLIALAAVRSINQSKSKIIHVAWDQLVLSPDLLSLSLANHKHSLAIMEALPMLKSASSNQRAPDAFDRFVRCGKMFSDPSDMLYWIREDASVEFSLWGLFYLGQFSLPKTEHATSSIKAINACLSRDFSVFHMILQEEDSHLSTCKLYSIDTSILSTHHIEISIAAFTALKIYHLVGQELGSCMTALQKDFDSFYEASQKQIANLAETLMKQEETMPPLESLHMLLATGNAIPPLESYLCGHSLGNQGLRKWKTSFQTGYKNIEAIIHGTVVPLLERILVHLTEILECSKLGEKYHDIGLSPTLIEECIESVLEFAQNLQRVRLQLKRDLSDFNEFFLWLTFSIEAISTLERADELATPNFDMIKVFAALDKLYNVDSVVGGFFGKNSSARPTAYSAPEISNSLKLRLKQVFDRVWEAVESNFKLVGEMCLGSMEKDEIDSNDFLENGWKPFVGISADVESVMIAVTLPNASHIVLYELSKSVDTSNTYLTVSKVKVSIDESSVSKASWNFVALTFLNTDVVVAIWDSEKTLLLQLDCSELEYQPCPDLFINSTSSVDHSSMVSEIDIIQSVRVECCLEMEVGKRVTELHSNSSQNVVSAMCVDNSFFVFTAG
ncbi:anaphase-promoting complex, cyclosome, subunit 4-domain-containing protein [Obelidium mucronatum]|nr:anaphase-promoting complex, cyclosome, subunit 4-domain-containing protein [Obelidium mucronatum]